MFNLKRLQYLKDNNKNVSLQFVAQYILQKTQRDKSEFSSYYQDEDWSELDQYLHSLDNVKKRNDLKVIKELLKDISESDNEAIENGFEDSLYRHLEFVKR